jgi:hypothetical protein
VNLYIFADKISCRGLKNIAMNKIQHAMYGNFKRYDYKSHLKGVLKLFDVGKVFENTSNSKDSHIRKYCVALASHRKTWNGDEQVIEGYFKIGGFMEEYAQYHESQTIVSSLPVPFQSLDMSCCCFNLS